MKGMLKYRLAAVALLMLGSVFAFFAIPADDASAWPFRRNGRFFGVRRPARVVRVLRPLRILLPRNWGVRAYGSEGYESRCSNGQCEVEVTQPQWVRVDNEPELPQ